MLRRVIVFLLIAIAGDAAAAERQVAITFDDLPDMRADEDSLRTQTHIIAALAQTLTRERIPAIGFVNEDKLLDENGRVDPRLVALLERWAAAGLDLGNHTYSHLDLNQVPLAAFEADLVRGETITRPLLARFGRDERWFRHPYLDTGRTAEDRRQFESALTGYGYRVAPVTIDDSDWLFGMAWEQAGLLTRWRLRRDYLRYMEARFAWYEEKSACLFGREIPQVLLLHADGLNAALLPRLIAMMRARGYRFISIDEATNDPAYMSDDTTTADGVSWIARWGMAMGLPETTFDGDPHVPPYVEKMAGTAEP